MRFPLIQLYVMNRSKPIVGIGDEEVQWDKDNSCVYKLYTMSEISE